ncbi:MAG: hypothetical protein ABI171_11980 [Collimonas sp.]|uniref:hypothetical protein n=1 Tax=Collimonas sp. TaxID=1963772 RepID=UPI00326392E3
MQEKVTTLVWPFTPAADARRPRKSAGYATPRQECKTGAADAGSPLAQIDITLLKFPVELSLLAVICICAADVFRPADKVPRNCLPDLITFVDETASVKQPNVIELLSSITKN